ncbi:hypothetical protein [Paraburkholderia sp. HD33-4]|uniref:hypothetical protein n=1 Tax=Paraburkholderia sp. HD33-4 TaxID=2883242 RepID=UPI001F25AD41|nr:hypothetical protein [Paraburkholderia sp. HD33-4]
MSADRVSLRILISRDDLREVDRRASAAGTPREVIAAQLVVQALRDPGQAMVSPATASTAPTRFEAAVWADSLGDPAILDALAKLAGA